jgi:regulatory protein
MVLDKKILGKLQRFCAYRERSTKEVNDKLTTLKIFYDQQQLYVKVLEEQKFLDEARFVKAFVNDKFKINRWGKIKIRQALSLFQVNDTLIIHALENIDDAQYLKALQHIIDRYKPKTKGLEKYLATQKILKHCYSKGYEHDITGKLLQDI